jgi:hypothetical protein
VTRALRCAERADILRPFLYTGASTGALLAEHVSMTGDRFGRVVLASLDRVRSGARPDALTDRESTVLHRPAPSGPSTRSPRT